MQISLRPENIIKNLSLMKTSWYASVCSWSSNTIEKLIVLIKIFKKLFIDDVCCAQFSEDEKWYRAQVLAVVDGEQVIVKYVDYGNIEQLPVSQ